MSRFNYTFKLLGKEVKSLNEQLSDALRIEDYETCAVLNSKIQDQKIKELLK